MFSLWGHKTSICEIVTVVLLFTYLFCVLERKRIITLGNMWGSHLPVRYQKSNLDWLKPEKGFVDTRWEEASWTTSLGGVEMSAGSQWGGPREEASDSVGQEAYPFLTVFIHLVMPGLICSMCGLVPWAGIEPGPPALGAQNLSHWHQWSPRRFILEYLREEETPHLWFYFISVCFFFFQALSFLFCTNV